MPRQKSATYIDKRMASPRSTPSAGSSRSLIPPIVSNEKDRQFLLSLNEHISLELGKVDRVNPEQRYIVYKDAFDKIIDYVSAYKPLLTAIKAEYEDCINTIQRGQREAFFLSGKLKALATQPSTIHNYRKRADELEQKISVIAVDNERLRAELKNVREARLERDKKSSDEESPPPKEVRKDKRHIPGLSLQQSTDTKILSKELEKVEKQLKDLNISYRTRFSPKDIRDTLKEQLSHKVVLRDQLQEQASIKKQRRHKLKVAVEAAQAYTNIQPPHQSIGEAVVNALARAGSQIPDKAPSTAMVDDRPAARATFEDDDPSQEKEAELMLEYIEKFNELLEDAKYEEAAVHAANSPKGILRTPETMHRFKDLQASVTMSGRSTLLAFCEALMATVPAYPTKPSDYLSEACIQCALGENRLDLVTHWLSQNRLTLTEALGDQIHSFGTSRPHVMRQCLVLAQKVYMDVGATVPAMLCMVRQGRVGQALQYAQTVRLPCEDCATVLASKPTLQLALGLFETKAANKRLMPMGAVAHKLIDSGHTELGIQFVRHIQHQGQDLENNPSPLRICVFEDELTTEDVWQLIVRACQDCGYEDTAIDILAAVTVIMSVRRAACYVDEMERQRKEEQTKKQAMEASSKKDKKKKKHRYQRGDEKAAVHAVSVNAERAGQDVFGGTDEE